MEPPVHQPATGALPRWMTLRGALLLIGAVTLVRIVYLVWLCPYELAGDEAQYWDWSRRLDLSYYSKGPGVAWLIAPFARLLGDTEWAVRLPAALSIGVAAASIAALAHSMCRKAHGAAFLAGACFLLVPGYQALGLLMTIDAPLVACWALGAWCAWELGARAASGRPTVALWLALAVVLGFGFLFKYTAVLLIPGLVLGAWSRGLRPDGRSALRVSLAVVLFALVVSPVFIWNQRHGWPTVAHLLGHLGAPGGDRPVRHLSAGRWSPWWVLEFAGAQLAMVGPLVALMAIACVRRWRTDPGTRFCVLASAPLLAFYFVVALATEPEANWAIAAYATLIPPVGVLLAEELPRRAAMLAEWRASAERPRPRRGFLRRAPETPAQVLWHWTVGWGLVAAVAVHFAATVSEAPGVGRLIPIHRVSGHRAMAERAHEAAQDLKARTGMEPLYITNHYMTAALVAFYAPGRPGATSASSLSGGRRSSYDYFPDTDLRSPALAGRPAVLIGHSPERWERDLVLDGAILYSEREGRRPEIVTANAYRGPRSPTAREEPTSR